ncbi:hypothetical protein [Lapidilactobacillus salsurivasis]
MAKPLRPRLSFEIRVLCEAQSDAHSELTRHTQRSPRPILKRNSELIGHTQPSDGLTKQGNYR